MENKIISLNDIEVLIPENQNDFINKKINEFVENLTSQNQSASYYLKNRNASNLLKIKNDIFTGKKAEVIAYYGFRENYNYPPIKIDIEIRNGKEKGWDVDLPFAAKDSKLSNVHVKSCNQVSFNYCNDFSWTFQYSNNSGRGGKDNIFKTLNDDLVALVFLENPEKNKGVIKAILPKSMILEKLKDPIKESLKGIKKCLYYQDLKEL